ncbi:MAG TPA: metallophosphoesterase [Ornithinibacter sp.]|nr:metallophosphoesterase [Ornithinibacter sp.]
MTERDGIRLLLLADTHLPRRAGDLPDAVWAEVERADVVVHAGDWVEVDLLDRLEARSRRLLACWGNNDGADLRARLPEVARATIAGVRVAVVHETGGREGRDARMRTAYPDTDLLVFGHSHIPWDTAHSGLRLLNPGSPTDRRRQPYCTYLTARLVDATVEDVVLHRLPPRGARDTPRGTPRAGASAKRRRTVVSAPEPGARAPS